MTGIIVIASLSVFTAIVCAVSGLFKGAAPVRFITKTLASILFVLTAFLAVLSNPDNYMYGVLICIALVLGMLGDIFLAMNPFLKDKSGSALFMLMGGFCFLAGHLFLLSIFFTLADFNLWLLFGLVVLPVIFVLFCKIPVIKAPKESLAEKLPLLDVGKLFVPIIIYSLVLGTMAIAALNVYLSEGGIRGILLLSAALMFVVSDTALAIQVFSEGEDKPAFKFKKFMPFVVLIFYYAAQCLFAISILY